MKPVHFAGEVSHSPKDESAVFERFGGFYLKTTLSSQLVTKKTHQNDNPCKACEIFQLNKQKVSKAF